MSPKIENPARLALAPGVVQVLQEMFAGYQKIVLIKEFGNGLSGGRVIEVRPIKANGAPELPTVVKLAAVSSIQKEWQAYREHLQNRLPQIPQVQARPVILPKVGWGGLRYTLLGDGSCEVVGLRDYVRQAETTPQQIDQACARLFKIMHNIWGFHQLVEDFAWQPSYDPILPVNLLIQTPVRTVNAQPAEISPAHLPLPPLLPGESVRVSGFALHKVDPALQTATLKASTLHPYAIRCQSAGIARLAGLSAGQIVDPFEGEVVETRSGRLYQEVQRAFTTRFDPRATTLPLAGVHTLPNPLQAWPDVLHRRSPAHIAAIHGDFNLENILIEPETGAIGVVDFAEAREDHVLHDLLRLETEVLTHLLPEIIHKQQLPLASTLAYLYWHLHAAPVTPASNPPPLPHPDLLKPWVMLRSIRQAARRYWVDRSDSREHYAGLLLYLLGALKFKNLNTPPEQPLPKQAAFLGATLVNVLLAEPDLGATQPPPALAALFKQLPLHAVAVTPPYTLQPANPYPVPDPQQQLATLPLDDVGPIGALPIPLHMPLSRNPLFNIAPCK